VVVALEDGVLVDLVGDTQNVVFVGNAGELFDVLLACDRAGRIGRRVDDERRGVVGDRLLDCSGVDR